MGENKVNRTIAEVFPPGEFIKDELDVRGWTQGDLADILGRTEPKISELINGKRSITPQTAKELAAAFGTSAHVWLNLETTFQLWKDQTEQTAVERRAHLYAYAPVKDMAKRGWIEKSSNLDTQEQWVLDFFGIKNLTDTPDLSGVAARTSTIGIDLSSAQIAWLVRVRQLARMVDAEPYRPSQLSSLLDELKNLMGNAEDVRRVPACLAKAGIRFVLNEHLPRTKIDGATMWLDAERPVIAMSTRYDRIDAFWFTLMHEIGHIRQRDGFESNGLLDIDMIAGPGLDNLARELREADADAFATDHLVSRSDLNEFIARMRPYYSARDIRGFAMRLGVHPGIVVGQLHHSENNWDRFRGYLVKIRHQLALSAMTDGWGQVVQMGGARK